MNVLILHNRYREPGGEERSVSQIAGLLRDRGHRAELLERSSADLAKTTAATAMLRGGLDPEDIARTVRSAGATVVHAHNINPAFGPRALLAARQAGARVVMHLHNYRLVCAVATTYRDGRPCSECHGRSTVPGIRHRCRGGLAEPLVYGAAISRAQAKVFAAVERFAVPSVAAVDRLGLLGLPTDRMEVLPNFLADDQFVASSSAAAGSHALFAGRLVEEKGADLAIEACARAGVALVVAGDGPERGRLERMATGLAAEVEFAGHVDAAELARLRAGAAFALVPSRWDEPCPYSVIEAMAAGLPVLASNLGGLPEMVGGAQTLAPDQVGGWAQAVGDLWGDRSECGRLGEQALARARDLFGAERFYSGLMRLYGEPA